MKSLAFLPGFFVFIQEFENYKVFLRFDICIMKKITLVLLTFLSFHLQAQIEINENFDQSALPSSWSTSNNSFETSNNLACQNFSTIANLSSQVTSATLFSPNIEKLSSGTEVDIQFNYKVLDNSASGVTNVATALGWGEIELAYSLDGLNWNTIYTIDDSNYIQSTSCTAVAVNITDGVIPIGSDFQLRFQANWVQGDYLIFIDDVNVDQVITNVPNCDAVITAPLDMSVDVNVNQEIQWQHATGGAVAYKVSLGLTPGDTSIANNVVVDGGNTSFDPGTLNELTTYYLSIIPYNSIGDAVGCTEYSFTTEDVCEVPTNLNFSTITPYEAEASWVETGAATEWEVIYGQVGFDINSQGTVLLDNDGVPNLIIDNLTPNTTYDVYVRSICAVNDYSDWSVLATFSTLVIPANDDCSNATAIASLPYSTSQDASWATNNNGFLSVCSGLGMNDGVWYTFLGDGYDLTVTVEETSLWDSEIAIYSGDCNNLSCVASLDLAADVQEITFNSTLNEVYYLNIGHYSGFIDNPEGAFNLDIIAEGPPPCLEPSNISFSQAQGTSIQVNWQENGIATSWMITYGLENFDPNSSSANSILDDDGVSNELLTGLIPNETYEVYITSICDPNSMSNAIGPISFNSSLSTQNHFFQNFQYYPNPVNSTLNLEATSRIDRIEIYNIAGKKIYSNTIGSLTHQLDVSFTSAGIYLMKVYIEDQEKTFKLIKN